MAGARRAELKGRGTIVRLGDLGLEGEFPVSARLFLTISRNPLSKARGFLNAEGKTVAQRLQRVELPQQLPGLYSRGNRLATRSSDEKPCWILSASPSAARTVSTMRSRSRRASASIKGLWFARMRSSNHDESSLAFL